MITVTLAASTTVLAEKIQDFAAEAGTFSIVQTVRDTVGLASVHEIDESDVVLIDADIGPLSAVDVARDPDQSVPGHRTRAPGRRIHGRGVGAGTLRGGFRGVIGMPLGLEDVSSKIEAAGQWSQRLRNRLTESSEDRRGRMIVMAGAKGGVGTTTIATQPCPRDAVGQPGASHLPYRLRPPGRGREDTARPHPPPQRGRPDRGCRRGGCARHLNDALYEHKSGLRILLPPPQGEHEVDITPDVARGILGSIRTRVRPRRRRRRDGG